MLGGAPEAVEVTSIASKLNPVGLICVVSFSERINWNLSRHLECVIAHGRDEPNLTQIHVSFIIYFFGIQFVYLAFTCFRGSALNL